MKINVKEYTWVEKEVDIIFPYYYVHNLDSDIGETNIYGMIDGENTVAIDESILFNGKVEYQISKASWSKDASYLQEKYKSSETEFNEAKARLEKFLSDL